MEKCINHEEHVKLIIETNERAKSNTNRLNNMEDLIQSIHGMNTNIALIANEMKGLTEAHRETQRKVDHLENKMETKDTVSTLRERIDVLEQAGGKLAIRAWLYLGSVIGAIVVGYLIARLTG
jgi:predicted nuclease with TOPRIM domain